MTSVNTTLTLSIHHHTWLIRSSNIKIRWTIEDDEGELLIRNLTVAPGACNVPKCSHLSDIFVKKMHAWKNKMSSASRFFVPLTPWLCPWTVVGAKAPTPPLQARATVLTNYNPQTKVLDPPLLRGNTLVLIPPSYSPPIFRRLSYWSVSVNY